MSYSDLEILVVRKVNPAPFFSIAAHGHDQGPGPSLGTECHCVSGFQDTPGLAQFADAVFTLLCLALKN